MGTTRFEHIIYEMNMYKMTWDLLQQFTGRDAMHNAVYESHVLHLRNLLDFFNGISNIHNDDIIISKVLTEHSRYSLEIDDGLRKMINKSVQHLTTYRADELDKEILSNEIIEIYPQICKRIEWFESDIDNPDKLIEEYKIDYEMYKRNENHSSSNKVVDHKNKL